MKKHKVILSLFIFMIVIATFIGCSSTEERVSASSPSEVVNEVAEKTSKCIDDAIVDIDYVVQQYKVGTITCKEARGKVDSIVDKYGTKIDNIQASACARVLELNGASTISEDDVCYAYMQLIYNAATSASNTIWSYGFDAQYQRIVS